MQYLAAVHFENGQDVDGLLEAFVKEQTQRGLSVKGVLQAREKSGGECHCADMDLHAIGSHRIFRISQSLGNGSSGCRLHPGALAECSAYLDQEIKKGADLLVLNRFGKGESEGRGFRDLISSALAHSIPVLIAVRPTYLSVLREFSGEYGVILPYERVSVDRWIESVGRANAA